MKITISKEGCPSIVVDDVDALRSQRKGSSLIVSGPNAHDFAQQTGVPANIPGYIRNLEATLTIEGKCSLPLTHSFSGLEKEVIQPGESLQIYVHAPDKVNQ